jgi:hypothetical protein
VRTLLLLVTVAALAVAAPYWHLTGRVVDEKGRPIEGVFFRDGAVPESEIFERYTNKDGRFDIWSGASRVVLHKPGYRDVVLTPKGIEKHVITMIKGPKEQGAKKAPAAPIPSR